jgi:hypothetical protein
MPVTELYLDRKLKHECTRGCGRPAAPHAQMCDQCAETQLDHQRRCMAQLRELRRDNGLCADCGAASGAAYRCEPCALKRK